MQIYDLLIYFFIYGFIGWVVEVAFHAVAQHKLVNRGFLNGAICPIYGVGMVVLIVCLEPVSNNLFLLFAGSLVICSILELITGFALEKIFGHRWWDYSDEPLNIGGYICIRFSICWGFAGVFAIKVVHDGVMHLTDLLPQTAQIVLAVVLSVLLVIDAAATVINVRGLNKELTHIDEMGDLIRKMSDDLTEHIYKGSISAAEKIDEKRPEIEADIEARKAEFEKRREAFERKKQEAADSLSYVQRRLIRAFPKGHSIRHREAMEHLRSRIMNKNFKKQ